MVVSSIGIVKWEYRTWNVELNQWIIMCNSDSVIFCTLESETVNRDRDVTGIEITSLEYLFRTPGKETISLILYQR